MISPNLAGFSRFGPSPCPTVLPQAQILDLSSFLYDFFYDRPFFYVNGSMCLPIWVQDNITCMKKHRYQLNNLSVFLPGRFAVLSETFFRGQIYVSTCKDSIEALYLYINTYPYNWLR